jgi:hypothetical protein
MGGANGSRECAPDDKLRDTHHDPNGGDGFREALNPSDDLLPDGQRTGRAGMAGLAGSHPVANDPLRNYARTG